MLDIVASFPRECTASVFIVVRDGSQPGHFPALVNAAGWLPASYPQDGTRIEPGRIYIAPPDRHMILKSRHIWLDRPEMVRHTRSAADPLFVSAAEAYGERVIGVVLSGADGESAQGLKAIMDHGGEALVEDREEAHRPGMSRTAVAGDCVSIPEVAKVLRNRCWH